MKCDKTKKWIYLNNSGELSDKEEGMLKEHLTSCISCQELLKNIESTGLYIQKLRGIQPELTYPQVLTSNIMQSISNNEKADKKVSLLTEIVDFLFSYKVRIVTLMIVFGLIGLFSYQQLFIIKKMNQLENKIASKYEVFVEPLGSPLIVNNKLFLELVSNTGDQQFSLNKRSMDRLLESYKDLKTDHDELIEILNDNLKKLERKLSKKDIEKLKKILKENNLEKKTSTNL